METVSIILFVVVAVAVIVSWATVVAIGFSKSKGRISTQPRRTEAKSQIGKMRNSGAWSLRLEALFCSLGGLVVVPAVFFAESAFQEPGLWHGNELGSLIFCLVFGLWFYAARRLGLWQIWRDVFSQRITMTGRVSEHWVEISKQAGTEYTGEVESRQYGVTVAGQPFKVSQKIYDWVSTGDEVVISYWPHSKRLATVEMVSGAGPIKERLKDSSRGEVETKQGNVV